MSKVTALSHVAVCVVLKVPASLGLVPQVDGGLLVATLIVFVSTILVSSLVLVGLTTLILDSHLHGHLRSLHDGLSHHHVLLLLLLLVLWLRHGSSWVHSNLAWLLWLWLLHLGRDYLLGCLLLHRHFDMDLIWINL